MRTLENALRRVGFVHVAGVDEVGRGCLAGPVVAAAVVLHPERHISGVCDSKTVPAAERERLYDLSHARLASVIEHVLDPDVVEDEWDWDQLAEALTEQFNMKVELSHGTPHWRRQ